MATAEQAGRYEVTPQNLQEVLDTLLDTRGELRPTGAIGVEFFSLDQQPGPDRDPERHPHQVLRRFYENNRLVYSYEHVRPHFRSHERKLFFEDDKVRCERETIGVGVDGGLKTGPPELTPEEMKKMHQEASYAIHDPRWQTRQETINAYHAAQRAQRLSSRILARFQGRSAGPGQAVHT